jgi:broad specificity phosphatase PhoE
MRKLILVKHARPDIDPGVPANRWRLAEAGRAASASLAQQLAAHQPAVVISSTEPKAVETAAIIAHVLGIPSHAAQGLHEHDRTNVGYQDETVFEAAIATFFARPGELVFGRETAAQAEERFSSAVEGVLRAHPQGNIVLVAHGTVITLYIARYATRHAQARIDPFTFWQRLGLPSYIVLSLPGYELLDVVESV